MLIGPALTGLLPTLLSIALLLLVVVMFLLLGVRRLAMSAELYLFIVSLSLAVSLSSSCPSSCCLADVETAVRDWSSCRRRSHTSPEMALLLEMNDRRDLASFDSWSRRIST